MNIFWGNIAIILLLVAGVLIASPVTRTKGIVIGVIGGFIVLYLDYFAILYRKYKKW